MPYVDLSLTLPPGFARRGRPGDDLPDSCKLYVGSLPESVTDDRIRSEFSAYGEVLHAIVLKDMNTQQVRDRKFLPRFLPAFLLNMCALGLPCTARCCVFICLRT